MSDLEYDPIKDEKKEFTLEEWADTLIAEIRRYVQQWKDANEFHKEKHTWTEWAKSFWRYMSW